LVKTEPDLEHSEYMKIEENGMKETYVTGDVLGTVEPVFDNDVQFNCDFSAEVSKRMDSDDGTYSCFVCQDTDPHSFNRASDLIRHSVSKHKQYPEQAKHNKPYLADGTDLRAAKADEILRCGDGSHRKKGMSNQQWEEIKKNARTKATEKKKKAEALKAAKKQEEVDEEEVTLNLNRALKDAKKKRRNLEAREKERKRVIHATDDVPKKPARRLKSEIVKLTGKELQKEIDREAQALNDANRDANLKKMAVKVSKMGSEVHAAYVKDKRDLENLAADGGSTAGHTPAVKRIPLLRSTVLGKEEGIAGSSKDPRTNRGDAPKIEQVLAEVHYDPKDVE